MENSLLSVLSGTNSLKCDFLNKVGSWENFTENLVIGGGRLELLSGGVIDLSLLGLVLASGEEDEFALVGVESCDVHCKLLLAGAGSSVINGDTDASGECGTQSSALQLSESETFSEADLTSILAGR